MNKINKEFGMYFDNIKSYAKEELSDCIFDVEILSSLSSDEVIEYISVMITAGIADIITSENMGDSYIKNGLINLNALPDVGEKSQKNDFCDTEFLSDDFVFENEDIESIIDFNVYGKLSVLLNNLSYSLGDADGKSIVYMIKNDDVLDLIKISIENIRACDVESIIVSGGYFAFDKVIKRRFLSKEVAISLGFEAVKRFEMNSYNAELSLFKEKHSTKNKKIEKKMEVSRDLKEFKEIMLETHRNGYFYPKVHECSSSRSIQVFNDDFLHSHMSKYFDDVYIGPVVADDREVIDECILDNFHLAFPIPAVSIKKEIKLCFEKLIINYPNFKEVTLYIKDFAEYSVALNKPFSMPNILLIGGPGIGKSDYTKAVSEAIGIHNEFISMSALSTAFEISGLTTKWGTGEPGMMFDAISKGGIANPLIVLDEIDKTVGTGGNSLSPNAVLLSLTEKCTASKFKESFFKMDIDFSHVNWIATGNDLFNIPTALISRFKKFNILSPKKEDMPIVFGNMYKSLLERENLTGEFTENLSDSVVKELSKLSLRAAKECIERSIIKSVISNLKLNEKYRILPSQLG